MKKKILLVTLAITNFYVAVAQIGDSKNNNQKITLKAYVDGYLSSYSNDLSQQSFQPFETVGARDNSFGVNVAQFGMHYETKWARANVTFHWGDIPQATWSTDYNQIQEANVGVRLSEGLWLDAGFFRTHIGTESFLPKDIMLSNTAYKTFFGPFYQAGAKLSYENLENWYFELWVLNGYNSFIDANDAKSVGTLITYHFNDNTNITYTNLYGRESLDDAVTPQNRFYQNLYVNHNWNEKWFVNIGFDYGIQTNSDLQTPSKTASLFAGLATLRYQCNSKWSITTRGEFFRDENGFISGTVLNTNGIVDGISLHAYSLGTEFRPIKNSYVRAETRYTQTADDLEIFVENGNLTNSRWEILVTMGLDLEKVLGF